MSRTQKQEDPYATVRRSIPPSDFPHRNKVLYNRKPRKHVKILIKKELEEFFSEREEDDNI